MEELAEGGMLAERYLLGPVIGHGAMGQVHLAEDLRLARPVAVKSLRPELARYPDVRQRFGQEARAAARISHPNVVRVYDSGEQGRIPYLVMECLPGITLVDELAWGPLEPGRARQVGLDLLRALGAAHHLGIVHRDVKPGNILLSGALDEPVKVSDFGIAKSADDLSLTESGALVGTAAYLAPERVAGGAAGPASDLYSAGTVLYEALAGRRPYEGETSLAIALAIHMGGAPSLLELRPDLDPGFAAVVERGIASDPSDRWRTAAEMADALRALRPGATRRSGNPSPSPLPAGVATAASTLARPAVPQVSEAAAAPAPRMAEPPATTAMEPPFDPPSGDRRATGAHRRVVALCAGAAAAVLMVAVVAGATRGGDGGPEPVSPPTSAELVSGAAPSSTEPEPVPVDRGTVAPVGPAAPVTTRPARRPVTPATTAAPAVRATTTTRAAVTTTRPPPTTASTVPAPITVPATTPTTAAALTAEPAV